MTVPVDVAKLQKWRDRRATIGGNKAYRDELESACAKVEDGGGGLLERHAMLEELAASVLEFADLEEDCRGPGWPWDKDAVRMQTAIAALRKEATCTAPVPAAFPPSSPGAG